MLLSEIYPGKQSAVPADTHSLHSDGLACEENEQFLLLKKLVMTQTLVCSQSLELVPPSFLQLRHNLLEGEGWVFPHLPSDWRGQHRLAMEIQLHETAVERCLWGCLAADSPVTPVRHLYSSQGNLLTPLSQEVLI